MLHGAESEDMGMGMNETKTFLQKIGSMSASSPILWWLLRMPTKEHSHRKAGIQLEETDTQVIKRLTESLRRQGAAMKYLGEERAGSRLLHLIIGVPLTVYLIWAHFFQ